MITTCIQILNFICKEMFRHDLSIWSHNLVFDIHYLGIFTVNHEQNPF